MTLKKLQQPLEINHQNNSNKTNNTSFPVSKSRVFYLMIHNFYGMKY